jgi:hypothetical protein
MSLRANAVKTITLFLRKLRKVLPGLRMVYTDIEELAVLMYELNENALNCIYNETYEKALLFLTKCRRIVELMGTERSDKSLLIVCSYNQALCFQK